MGFKFWRKSKCQEKPYSVADEFTEYLKLWTDSTALAYITNRIIKQIEWYDKKAIKSQQHFRRYSAVVLWISAFIPVATLLISSQNTSSVIQFLLKMIPAVLSALVLVFSSLASQERYQSLWVSYRSNCEVLKSILHRYFTKSREFSALSDAEALNILVSVCEEYMIKEFETWTKANEPKADRQKSSSSTAS